MMKFLAGIDVKILLLADVLLQKNAYTSSHHVDLWGNLLHTLRTLSKHTEREN
jgi:hypothetical protein